MQHTADRAAPAAGPAGGAIAVLTARQFLKLSRGYWRGRNAGAAWALTLGVLALVLVGIAIQIGINRWNGLFFNAIERKDWSGFALAIQSMLALALAMAAAGAAYIHVKMRLQVGWRQWLTLQLVDRWLADRRFYRLSVANGAGISNPEYRIADDVRAATEPLVEFVAAIITSVLTAGAFIGILLQIGGTASFSVGGADITIPGFMVLSVLVYSGGSTVLMVAIGRPLVARIETRNASEAEFRYELTRVRENAEQIALSGADGDERDRLRTTFSELVLKWVEVIRREARMTALTNGSSTLTPVIPLLLCAPKYLQGSLTLGELVQLASAFMLVHQSLNWLADNAIRVAEWLASAQRVVAIGRVLDQMDEAPLDDGRSRIVIADSPDKSIRLERLAISEPGGRTLIGGSELIIPPGQNVLVRGASGAGKSTLVRALAGLWPWGTGTIRRPAAARITFLLQRPVIAAGTLREALVYAAEPTAIPDDRLREIMRRCGLSHLAGRLEEVDAWAHTLQGGEQQRLAFVRLLIDPPDIVIMDEATSALDESSEAAMMDLLHAELAAVTAICVGRRAGLEPFFERHLALVHDPVRRVTIIEDVTADRKQAS